MDFTTSKSAKIDELSKKGTDVHVAMDGFVHNQKNASSMMEAHDEAIESLGNGLKMVEQQVKAMARIMAASNVQNLRKDREEAMQNMRIEVLATVKKKSDELTDRMNREFDALTSKKNDMFQKFNQLEDKLTESMERRTEESARARAGLADLINKLDQKVLAIEMESKIERQQVTQYVDLKNAELKKLIQSVQGIVGAERTRADQNFLKAEQERAKLKDLAHETISAAKEELQEYVKTMERQFQEKHSTMLDEAEKTARDAQDDNNQLYGKCKEMTDGHRMSLHKIMNQQEADLDRKVSMVGRQIIELKKHFDKEAAVREQSVSSLRVELKEEKNNRDHDEEKLLGMISQCMATLDKMHRH